MLDDTDSSVLNREILFLDAGRCEYQSQEALNKEINLKVFGILAFIITLFAISFEFVSVHSIPPLLMFLVFLNFAVCIGLGVYIVKPVNWLRPFDLMFIKDELYKYEARGIAYSLAEGYAETVESNRRIVDSKSSWLTWLLRVTFMFLILIISTIFYDPIQTFFQMA